MTARRIVVLGGSGFVGSALVARLAAQGDNVVVPVRRRAPARHLILLPTVDVVEADVHDPATLAALVRGADAVVNLVGILNESGRTTFERVHADLTRGTVDACRAGGVRRLLHMSALNADPSGPSRYLRSKGEAEAAVVASGLAWTIFRPSVIFGAGDSFLTLFARLARALPVIALAAPDARFQPVHVGDVVTAQVGQGEEQGPVAETPRGLHQGAPGGFVELAGQGAIETLARLEVFVAEGVALQAVVGVLVEQLTVEVVSARLGHRVDHAAGEAAVLHVVRRHLDADA